MLWAHSALSNWGDVPCSRAVVWLLLLLGGEAGSCLSRAACTQQPWGTWRLLAGSFCMLSSCGTWCAPDAPRAFLFVHPQHGYVPELCCLSCSLLSLLCSSFPSDGIRVWVVLYVLGRSCLSERKCLFHTALGFEGNRDQDWR